MLGMQNEIVVAVVVADPHFISSLPCACAYGTSFPWAENRYVRLRVAGAF